MTTYELRQILIGYGADDTASMMDVLEDADALYHMGITDADVLAVECLHAELLDFEGRDKAFQAELDEYRRAERAYQAEQQDAVLSTQLQFNAAACAENDNIAYDSVAKLVAARIRFALDNGFGLDRLTPY